MVPARPLGFGVGVAISWPPVCCPSRTLHRGAGPPMVFGSATSSLVPTSRWVWPRPPLGSSAAAADHARGRVMALVLGPLALAVRLSNARPAARSSALDRPRRRVHVGSPGCGGAARGHPGVLDRGPCRCCRRVDQPPGCPKSLDVSENFGRSPTLANLAESGRPSRVR